MFHKNSFNPFKSPNLIFSSLTLPDNSPRRLKKNLPSLDDPNFILKSCFFLIFLFFVYVLFAGKISLWTGGPNDRFYHTIWLCILYPFHIHNTNCIHFLLQIVYMFFMFLFVVIKKKKKYASYGNIEFFYCI